MSLPPGLLPEGLRDRLPPEAEAQARVVRALLDTIAAHGYDRVAPPLAEFEEGLVARLKSSQPQDLLRLVDPLSQRTLAIRPDITPQIGRIVATRLANAPRPLRLAYAGPVLRLRAPQLAPAREAMQLGAELVGSDSVAAACEIVAIAVEALGAAGVADVTVDLTLPDLVETLTSHILPTERVTQLKTLLDMKDAGALSAAGFADWLPLMAATGAVPDALDRLRRFDHAGLLATRIAGIAAIADAIGSAARVTIDPTERHGFEYQSWFGFTLLAPGTDVLGRGGSYGIDHPGGDHEVATGFSIYPDSFLAEATTEPRPRLFLPIGTDPARGRQLRADGWTTVSALDAQCDAAMLACTHQLTGAEILAV